jgi:DNA-binding CsgD family transcriptional regulator
MVMLVGGALRYTAYLLAGNDCMAIEIFERIDAVPWAARARTQLRATGETVRRYEDSPARLTPQELQVAQLVATGASTKSVAAQLYISPRTVDSHLRQVFTKLGIASRAALRDVDLTGETVPDGSH